MSEPTQILEAISVGDRAGVARLMDLVYDDMRNLAHKYLSGSTPNHTLAPTAVVHEAFIRLVDADRVDWRGKSHFFAVGAKAMRQILVDYARQRSTLKRGGDRQRIPIDPDIAVSASQDEDVLALNEALEDLAKFNSQRALIVELRFFGGMSIKEVSEALGMAERTVVKQWATTRIWLRRYLVENHGKSMDQEI